MKRLIVLLIILSNLIVNAQSTNSSVLKTLTIENVAEQSNSLKILADDSDTLFLLKYWQGKSGFAVGKNNTTVHYGSLTLGDSIENLGVESYAFGRNLKTCACSSFQYAFGKNIETVENQMIFGVGIDKTHKLIANEDNCIAFGYNDTLPSLVIQKHLTHSKGKFIADTIGVGVENPQNVFEVKDLIKFQKVTNSAFIGFNAGYRSTGSNNNFFGYWAGKNNTTGVYNQFIGGKAGYMNTTGRDNNFIGAYSGESNTSGSKNIAIGTAAMYYNTTGSHNVIIGHSAGQSFQGAAYSGNVFIGYFAGANETKSNRLYISNSNTSTPLIYGEFDTKKLIIHGQLEVETTTGALIVPRLTTAEITALNAVNGMIVYDTDKKQFEFYENGTWVSK